VTFRAFALKVVLWQLAFSVVLVAGSATAVPRLMVLRTGVARAATAWLASTLSAGCFVALALTGALLLQRRSLVQSIVRASGAIDQLLLPRLNDDPWWIANSWVLSQAVVLGLSGFFAAPGSLNDTTLFSLCFFSITLAAAASLSLLIAVRGQFVRVLELVPPEVMHDVIDAQVRTGHLRGRTSRRLLAAIVTPVALLGIGSALLVGSHVAAYDEGATERTLAVTGRATLVPAPGENPESPAIGQAQAALARRGFLSRFISTEGRGVAPDLPGVVLVRLPGRVLKFEYGSDGSWPIDWKAIVLGAAALLSAGYVGLELSGRLSLDLRAANRSVRTLGTEAALEGTRVMRPARYRAVAELTHSVEQLSDRFRMFAQAQERSISSREAATRTRGRFFAKFSHDLKSPLNAILGFAELTKRDPGTTVAQKESLDLILRGGNELLALVETILDAARVEAGQLNLDFVDVALGPMLDDAVQKAEDLSGVPSRRFRVELSPDAPPLVLDPRRFPQALATFIAHAGRIAEREEIRILVSSEPAQERPNLRRRKVQIFIEVPSSQFSAQELEALLSPETHPGQHRGMALALRLAKSIVELHGGTVSVAGRTVSEPAFVVQMRARPGQ
jgi:signal transduction histidine kinase